ncbi:MAG: PilN domain-containing protein [Gammaproteobacteria bacterium]|nr:PilN domain-containing protein [Gammaproteobacteria bacterium]
MAQINLLPWREAQREERKKEFITINIAVFLLAAVLAGLTWMVFDHVLSGQQQANQQITTENARLDAQLKSLDGLQARRDEIISRMKVIQDLQGQRPVVVRIFDELPRLVPANVYLTKFVRAGDKFTINGRAQSPNDVSEFLRNLEASPWFRNAFMNSFQGVPANTSTGSGGVAPRPEDSYGDFVISVDLEVPESEGSQAKKGQSSSVKNKTGGAS